MTFSQFVANIHSLINPLEQLQDLFSAMPLDTIKTMALARNQWVGPENGEVVGEPSFTLDENETPCIVYYTNLGGVGYIDVDEELMEKINIFNQTFDVSIF